jgi:spheroidene monooxygenase
VSTLGGDDPGVAALLMFRLRPTAVPWALWRLARGASGLGAVPGMRFARVLGSGQGGGFGLRPGLDCQGVFALFDTLEQAQHFTTESRVAQAYGRRALEQFSVVLQATSARGSWAGHRMAAGASAEPGPLPR